MSTVESSSMDLEFSEEDLYLNLDDELTYDQGMEENDEVVEVSRHAAKEIRDSLRNTMKSINIPEFIPTCAAIRKRSKSHPEIVIIAEVLKNLPTRST